MWSSMKSLMLSRVINVILFVFSIIMLFIIPYISDFYCKYIIVGRPMGHLIVDNINIPTTAMFYAVDIFVITALIIINSLLKNISKAKVFVEENTAYIRAISWICMGIGFIFFMYGFIRVLFFVSAVIVIFIGLIMRVLKNVFEKAVEIKSENDLTV